MYVLSAQYISGKENGDVIIRIRSEALKYSMLKNFDFKITVMRY